MITFEEALRLTSIIYDPLFRSIKMDDNYIYIEGKKIPISDETVASIRKVLPVETYKIGQRFVGKFSGDKYRLLKDGKSRQEAMLVNLTKNYANQQRLTLIPGTLSVSMETFYNNFIKLIVPIEDDNG